MAGDPWSVIHDDKQSTAAIGKSFNRISGHTARHLDVHVYAAISHANGHDGPDVNAGNGHGHGNVV